MDDKMPVHCRFGVWRLDDGGRKARRLTHGTVEFSQSPRKDPYDMARIVRLWACGERPPGAEFFGEDFPETACPLRDSDLVQFEVGSGDPPFGIGRAIDANNRKVGLVPQKAHPEVARVAGR